MTAALDRSPTHKEPTMVFLWVGLQPDDHPRAGLKWAVDALRLSTLRGNCSCGSGCRPTTVSRYSRGAA
jgi:hypothetical protein